MPIPKSRIDFSIVSFVRLFWGLSTTTCPIGLGRAKDFVEFGSEFGLSLLVCG